MGLLQALLEDDRTKAARDWAVLEPAGGKETRDLLDAAALKQLLTITADRRLGGKEYVSEMMHGTYGWKRRDGEAERRPLAADRDPLQVYTPTHGSDRATAGQTTRRRRGDSTRHRTTSKHKQCNRGPSFLEMGSRIDRAMHQIIYRTHKGGGAPNGTHRRGLPAWDQ